MNSDPAPVPPAPVVVADPWTHLRRHTSARIALGRSGGSLPTRELLAFQADHAAARDAVQLPFDSAGLAAALEPLGWPILELASAAPDRATYLRRPDLGRRLSAESRCALPTRTAHSPDLLVIVSDGLSALAAHQQVPPLLAALLPRLRAARWKLAPLCLVRHARVALLDELGPALGAQLAVILLGERPGLGTPDSLGAYIEFDPRPGRTDAERNCLSNIRPGGLPPAEAAAALFELLGRALQHSLTGVRLPPAESGAAQIRED